eukprot:EG_transcript_40243
MTHPACCVALAVLVLALAVVFRSVHVWQVAVPRVSGLWYYTFLPPVPAPQHNASRPRPRAANQSDRGTPAPPPVPGTNPVPEQPMSPTPRKTPAAAAPAPGEGWIALPKGRLPRRSSFFSLPSCASPTWAPLV